jgi:hypothetical protein
MTSSYVDPPYVQLAHATGEAWLPPARLTREVLLPYRNEDWIWLSTAINLMTFGCADSPQVETWDDIARKQPAARALFHAAGQRLVSLKGTLQPAGEVSKSIPAEYFILKPRILGSIENSIVTDAHLADDDELMLFLGKQDRRWFHVRVSRTKFVKWMFPAAKQARRAGDVGRATEVLAAALPDNPRMTRAKARRVCEQAGYSLTQRDFQERAWPDAREKAGLPRRAPGGAPKRSSQ